MRRGLEELIAGLALIAVAALPLGSEAAPAAVTPLSAGKAALVQKNYATAVKQLETAVKQSPQSCECRLCFGRALCGLAATMKKDSPQQLSTYKRGASELRKAIRLGRGSKNAQDANRVLLSLPKAITSPKMGEDTPLIALAHGIRGADRAAGEIPKPKVLEFYASWCEPCKQLKPLVERAKGQYGEQVEFISYNVDDPNTEKIVEDYEVSPIPTLIFLDPSNQVVSYSIGFAGEGSVEKGIKKILSGS